MRWQVVKIYCFKFFDDFLLIAPFYALFFSESHVSAAQLAIIFATWSVVTFILEIPSGVIADTVDRRWILFGAQLARAIGCVVWFLYPTFIGFVIGMALWGIKSAFTSGTFQALTFDTLKHYGREADYSRVIGRARTASYLGGISAGLLAAWFVPFGYPILFYGSVLACVVAGVTLLLLPAIQIGQSTEERGLLSVAQQGLSFVMSSPAILTFLILVALFQAQYSGIEEYFPLIASVIGVSKPVIALWATATGLVMALGSYLAHRFEHLNSIYIAIFISLSGIVFYIGTTIATGTIGLGFITLYAFIYSILMVVLESRIQHSITTSSRAMVTSIYGFFHEITMILIFYTAFGWYSELYGLPSAFSWFGVAVIFFGLVFILVTFFGLIPKLQTRQ